MKFTPRTEPEESTVNQILELAMIFVFSFISSYCLAFFGPMTFGKSGVYLTAFVADHLQSFVTASFIVAAFVTFNFFKKKSMKIIITSIAFSDIDFTIGLWRKYYYKNAIEQITITYKEMNYEVIDMDEDAKIEIAKGDLFLGSISSRDVIWEDEPLLMKQILHKLKEIKVQLKTPAQPF